MSEVVAQRVPMPSSWGLPQSAPGVSIGRQHVTRYLRQASRAVEAAVARIRPDAGARVPVLDPGPWEGPEAVTPGPAGWFAFAVQASGAGFRLGSRTLGAAEMAQVIWHCPRWRGRPVLLVVQASAPADGAGPILRQLAVELGAPVYASDAGIRFTFGRAFTGGLFWCWRPYGRDEPEPAGRLLPPLGPVRARHTPPGRHRYRQPPSPVPPPAIPTDPSAAQGPGTGEPCGPAALEVRGQRMGVLASNIANASTPGFKARDIDFQQALSAATGPGGLTDTGLAGATKYRVPTQPSLDGNTVDLSTEQTAFAENAVQDQSTLSFLNGRIGQITRALRGE